MKSSIRKRIDALEQGFGEDLYVVIWKGFPPYVVCVHHLNDHSNDEPFLINTPEELEAYRNSLPASAQCVTVVVDNLSSIDMHECAQ